MSENWEISIFRKNSNYLIHLIYFKRNLESYVKNYGKGSGFNFYLKNVSRDSGLKDLIFVWKSNLKIKTYLLTYNQQNLTIFITFHATTLSLTYLSTQISFGKPFWWGSTELGYWKEGEIHMFERAPVKLLALLFVSSLFSIERVRIVFQDTSTLTLPDFALLIFDFLCNQLVGNKCIHL